MTDKNKKIIYIDDNINELRLKCRQDILQMIINSHMDKVVEKGSGAQIKYADISDETLDIVYNYIKNTIESTTELY